MSNLLKRTIGIAAILMLVAVSAHAAEGTLTGKVMNQTTGQPVAGAWVGIVATNLGAASDSVGQFVIKGVPAGIQEIRVSHPQFSAMAGLSGVTAEILPDKTTTISLWLGSRDDSSITTKGKADMLDIYSTGAEVRISQESIKHRPVQDGDQPLREVPGLQTQSTGEVSIRAGRAGEVSLNSRRDHKSSGQSDYARIACPQPFPNSLPPTDMFFRNYGTNDYVQTSQDKFSTFALDVDDASFSVAAEYIRQGHLPPADAIRVEEFVNHFEYGYAPPDDSKFRIFTELVQSPFEQNVTLFKIGIKGREIERNERLPLNLTVVVDVSGSMGQGNRIELVRQSIRQLSEQLNRHDQIGIVAYGSQAYRVLEPTIGTQKHRILSAINSLFVGGSTYAEAGLRLGYEMARKQYVSGHNNLIVLCSDGVANVGRTSADEIMRSVRGWAKEGISLSCFGFGMGNYNDVLLEELSQKGNGRYAYINDQEEGRRQFVDNFMGNIEMLARDAKVQVEFNPKVVDSYRLLGYENRDVADYRFRDNSQDGGEIGSGHEVTALYALNLRKNADRGDVGTVFVRWTDTDGVEVSEVSRLVKLEQHRAKFAKARPELRLAIVAAQFAEMAKGTEYAQSDYRRLLQMAESIHQQMGTPQTAELVDLIRKVEQMENIFSDYHPNVRPRTHDKNYRR